MSDNLTLAQEFVLLATDSAPHKLIRLQRSYLQTYTIGAVLVDLVLENVIRLDDKGKLKVIENAKTDDAGTKLILQRLMEAGRNRTMKRWIQYFYSRSGLRSKTFDALMQPLVRKGCVRPEQYRILGLFPATRYMVSPSAKDRVVQRMRAELLENGPVSDQTAALAMLLEACKVLKNYFSTYELSELKLKLQQLQEEQSERWATIRQIKKAINEFNAAVVAASSASV